MMFAVTQLLRELAKAFAVPLVALFGFLWEATGANYEALSLEEVWQKAQQFEPGYQAQRELDASVELEWQALRRERFLTLAVSASADHGQRVRPGEERDMGISRRGELLARGSWVFADSGQASREALVSHRRKILQSDAHLFDNEFRSELARIFVETAFAETRFELTRKHVEQLRLQLDQMARRVSGGVERVDRAHLAERQMHDLQNLVAEIAQEMDLMRGELSAFAGTPTNPKPVVPKAFAPEARSAIDNPGIHSLRAEAEERLLLADNIRDQDRWSLEVFGAGGTYFSRAFENRSAHSEFYVGVGAQWNPDFAGVNRHQALAEQRRARAELARADSEERQLDRQLERLRGLQVQLLEREDLLTEKHRQTARQLEIETLRWQEGVGSWDALLGLYQELYELELERIDLQLQQALAWIQYAELTGALSQLAGWLGQH